MKADTQPDAAKHGTSRAGVAGGDVSDAFCLQEIHHPSQVGSFGRNKATENRFIPAAAALNATTKINHKS
jgi:hypothetical protein